ncbi:hypothetical protein JR316_0008071 [Psilocybe cubensis]|uniref:Uncharacterized protein n=2 Tax=Psilocybe cubensis TaxID=181762 RepID=A0A8H8CI94_PSICU|nr:hypothetical protein JR316_0008071 [Psilocybe cubensis]KAH9479477.1 hypothetical protein JR316_0008071 [Psilocybe cubensis]
MFRTHSPYSPFFTSGLLSSSRPSSPDVPLSPTRRGSLPTDSPRVQELPSAFYFTLQPQRDEDEFRSYLSLDLAESQSMRSASLKRTAASTTKPFVFPPIPETPALSLRMRRSRDSLRTIPSPKPAPSITLPDLPKQSPPRLPSLHPLPALEISIPTRVSVPRTAPLTLNRMSVATTSTVSTRARRQNRSEALARLEGRSGIRTAPLAYPKRNFMSMSDDEDDDEQDHADDENDDSEPDSDLESLHFPDLKSLHNPLLEPEDMVLPLPTPDFLQAPRSAPLPPRSPTFVGGLRRQRTKNRATKDWFPLKSFIDLRNDDDRMSTTSSSWAWRSFIQVANVS